MYEGSVCVGCMSTDNLLELFGTNPENYAEMLTYGLNIQVTDLDGHNSICVICAAKLKDCVVFKKQVLSSLSILSSADLYVQKAEEIYCLVDVPKQEVNEVTLECETEVNEIHVECETELKEVTLEQATEIQEKSVENECQTNNTVITKVVIPIPKPGIKKKRIKKKKVPGVQAKLGRPRIRSPDLMPYKIDEKEHICRECGEEFLSYILLKAHYNVHFGKHPCSVCGKRFVTHSSMKKHEYCHQIGPFNCNDCGQEFHNRNSFKSHVRIKHQALPFPCKVCGHRFSSIKLRTIHLAHAHQFEEQRYACPRCPRTFPHTSQRDKHITEFHEAFETLRAPYLRVKKIKKLQKKTEKPAPGNRRFVCKLCNQDFNMKHVLKCHIASHIRRKEYKGDPMYLFVDQCDRKAKKTDVSSEDETEESEEEIYIDIDESMETNIDTKSDEGSIEYLDEAEGIVNKFTGRPEIFTDIGFPSDLDE